MSKIRTFGLQLLSGLLMGITGLNHLHAQDVREPSVVQVFDKATKQPLEFATCVLHAFSDKTRETPLAHGVTDEDGRVQFSLAQPALITIQYLGHETLTDTLLPGQVTTYSLAPYAVNLDEVVVTGQFAPTEIRNSIFKVEVIDRSEIDQVAAVNLQDILARELNMGISQDDVFGSNLSIQGIDGANVKILVDGVPMIGRLNNQLDISQLNLNNAERIEVIRGPLSVVYGTNALAGVVNIITNKQQEERFSANINGQYESHGRYNLDGRLGYRFKRQFIQFNGGRYFFDGFSDPDTTRNMQWNPKEQYFANGLYTRDFRHLNLRLQADYFQELIMNRYDPINPYSIIAKDDYYKTFRQNYMVAVEDNLIESDHHFDFMAAFSVFRRLKNSYFKNLVTLEDNLTSDPADQDTTRIYQFSSRGSYSIESEAYKVSFQLGIDINSEWFRGERVLDEQQSISDYAVFSTVKYKPVDKLIIQPGIRFAHNTKYNAPLTPALNIKYNASNSLTLRASYARGFRAPNLKELYLFFVDINHNIQGNDSLQAEKGHNAQLDLSLMKRLKSNYLTFDSKLYFNSISDRINLAFIDPASNLYSYVNIYESVSIGGELKVGYQFERMQVSTGAALNWTGNRFEESQEEIAYNFTPQLVSELQYTIPKWNMSINALNKWNGRAYMFGVDSEDATVSETMIDPYNILDLSVRKSFWKDRIALTAGMRNVLGVTNIAVNGLATGIHSGGASNNFPVSPGRVFFAKANLYFHK